MNLIFILVLVTIIYLSEKRVDTKILVGLSVGGLALIAASRTEGAANALTCDAAATLATDCVPGCVFTPAVPAYIEAVCKGPAGDTNCASQTDSGTCGTTTPSTHSGTWHSTGQTASNPGPCVWIPAQGTGKCTGAPGTASETCTAGGGTFAGGSCAAAVGSTLAKTCTAGGGTFAPVPESAATCTGTPTATSSPSTCSFYEDDISPPPVSPGADKCKVDWLITGGGLAVIAVIVGGIAYTTMHK